MQEAKLNNNKESTETGFASKELMIKNPKEQLVESICHKGGARLLPALKVR